MAESERDSWLVRESVAHWDGRGEKERGMGGEWQDECAMRNMKDNSRMRASFLLHSLTDSCMFVSHSPHSAWSKRIVKSRKSFPVASSARFCSFARWSTVMK